MRQKKTRYIMNDEILFTFLLNIIIINYFYGSLGGNIYFAK